MKNTFYLLILLITFLCSFTGCGKPDASAESNHTESVSSQMPEENTETPSVKADSISNTLRFVDALGEWHETEILSNVKKHPYLWECLSNDADGISYEGDENYRIRHGVDVSKWQGTIDWEKVRAAGYEFAILRLGYRGYGASGELAMDETFYKNIEHAQAAGMDVGIYFFSQAVNEAEALEEAAFVLDALEGYTLQLPIVYDPELIRDQPARTNEVSGEQFTKNTIVFCEAIKSAGYEPMIYSNMIWEAFLFDMTQLQDYPFWYADYENTPQTPYDFKIWQYSETGSVDGINGNADLNILFEPVNEE